MWSILSRILCRSSFRPRIVGALGMISVALWLSGIAPASAQTYDFSAQLEILDATSGTALPCDEALVTSQFAVTIKGTNGGAKVLMTREATTTGWEDDAAGPYHPIQVNPGDEAGVTIEIINKFDLVDYIATSKPYKIDKCEIVFKDNGVSQVLTYNGGDEKLPWSESQFRKLKDIPTASAAAGTVFVVTVKLYLSERPGPFTVSFDGFPSPKPGKDNPGSGRLGLKTSSGNSDFPKHNGVAWCWGLSEIFYQPAAVVDEKDVEPSPSQPKITGVPVFLRVWSVTSNITAWNELGGTATQYSVTYTASTPDYSLTVQTAGGMAVPSGSSHDENTVLHITPASKPAGRTLTGLTVNGVSILANETSPGSGVYTHTLTANVTSIQATYAAAPPPTPTQYTVRYEAPSGYQMEVRIGAEDGPVIPASTDKIVDAGKQLYVKIFDIPAGQTYSNLLVNGVVASTTQSGEWRIFPVDSDISSITASFITVQPGQTLVIYECEHGEVEVKKVSNNHLIASPAYVNHNEVLEITLKKIDPGYEFVCIEVNRKIQHLSLDNQQRAYSNTDQLDTMRITVWLVEPYKPTVPTFEYFLSLNEPTNGILSVQQQSNGETLVAGQTYRVSAGDKFDVKMEPDPGYTLSSSIFDTYPLEEGVFTVPQLEGDTKSLRLWAVFIPEFTYYSISWMVEEEGEVRVVNGEETELSSGVSVLLGTPLTISAKPAEGYMFESFTINGLDRFSAEDYKKRQLQVDMRVEGNVLAYIKFVKDPKHEPDTPNPSDTADNPTDVRCEALANVLAFPNPLTGPYLRLTNTENVRQYTLYNPLGQIVLRGMNGGYETVQIPVEGLAPGFYVLLLETADGGRRAVRLVK